MTPLRPVLRATLALALFITIWSAKLVTIDRYGSDLPYWDQWAKEGDYLLTPWAERQELWKNLFLPHNEHRIAPTLALNLILVAQGAQWDARVQCVASAALHAALAASLFLWALRRFPLPWALSAGGVLILAVAPPIAWENVLGGFQSQFYFLSGFTLFALHALLSSPALSVRWWLGAASGLLALVSMGSGLLVAAPLVAIGALRFLPGHTSRRDTWLTLAAAVVIGGLGVYLRTPAPWHDTLHAKTVGAFLVYAARCLSWPLPQHPWLAPFLWLPWLGLLILRLRSALRPPPSAPNSTSTDFLLAAGFWVLLQIAAVTYSRAGDGAMPASRYGDIAALGLIVSAFALAQLATLFPCRGRNLTLFSSLYLCCLAACVVIATRDVIAGPLPDKKKESLASERSVHAFVLTDDYETFAKSPLPFPLPDWLARILRRPDIRAVLPTSVRAPLRIEGFSPPVDPAPPLPHRRIYAHTSSNEWRSAQLPASGLAFWKIETAGPGIFATHTPALAPLVLSPEVPITPTRPPAAGEWRAAYVASPTKPATLLARAPRSGQWLALSEPVEMSALSFYTWQLGKHGAWLALVGLASFLVLSLLVLLSRAPAASPPRANQG